MTLKFLLILRKITDFNYTSHKFQNNYLVKKAICMAMNRVTRTFLKIKISLEKNLQRAGDPRTELNL